MEGGGELGGGEEMKVAIVKAAAEGALAAVARPNSDRADRIFKFAMRSLIVLGICYFVLLAYVTATEPQLEKLYLVPFYIIAVTVPLYAAALMQERGNSIVSQEALKEESERLWQLYQKYYLQKHGLQF